MSELNPGIYEALVTETLCARLVSLDSSFRPARPLHKADAADRIALHLSRQIEQSLAAVSEDARVQVGIEVAQALTHGLPSSSTLTHPTRPSNLARYCTRSLSRVPMGHRA